MKNEIMAFHGLAHTIVREEESVIDSEIKNTIKIAAPGGRCTIIAGGMDYHSPPEKVAQHIRAFKKYGKYPIKI
jgi:hypothetical protein